MSPFASPTFHLTDQQVDELIIPCLGSTPVTAITLFPEHFTRPFCSVHKTIFDILDNDSVKLAAVAAPRGFGKTTTVGLGFIARKVLFREVHYIVYISSTVTEAAAKVKTLARELVENEMIRELFGDLKGVKWAENSGEIELSDENGPFCFIQAKGAGSQVRGLKWGKYRPDIFLIDDLEDAEEVLNDDLRLKLKEWFFADVIGAMDQAGDSKTRLFLIGTILHEDSLLANLIDEGDENDEEKLEPGIRELLKNEQFVTVRLEACDDQFTSVWPEYLTSAQLKAKALAYEKRGLLDVFYREWRNIVIAKTNASFQKNKFRYYQPEWPEVKECDKVIIVDPAKTNKQGQKIAKTAIICVGFNPVKNRVYFIDCLNDRYTPDETFENALNMADKWGTHVIGVEVTGLNNYITYPFQQFMKKRHKHYELVEIKAVKEKIVRVGALVPFYNIGAIYHNPDPAIRLALETQLCSYPRSKYWDVMDDFANFIEMFNIGEWFFSMDFPTDTDENDENSDALQSFLASKLKQRKLEQDLLEEMRKLDEIENMQRSKNWRCA